MTISDIKNILDCTILCGEDQLGTDINTADGADMMSDVLAFAKEHGVLLTGLVNSQVVRTAEMMDMTCIVFVRDKTPDQSIVDLADNCGIVIMKTREMMFSACGKLYEAGIRSEASSI
ncbi:MAG: hypothetical protein FWG42_07195 [Clostridiales bacterium]|nr:hypothetical protein [Clostridiales bacterium]